MIFDEKLAIEILKRIAKKNPCTKYDIFDFEDLSDNIGCISKHVEKLVYKGYIEILKGGIFPEEKYTDFAITGLTEKGLQFLHRV